MVLSQGAPLRKRLERRLPALSSLRGQMPAQETRWPSDGKRLMSMPISEAITVPASALTPGIELRCLTAARKGSISAFDLSGGGFEGIDLLEMEAEQKAMLLGDAAAQSGAQLCR